MLTIVQLFGGTFIVLLVAALGWTCWCWSKAEVRAANAEHERDRALEGKLACNESLTLNQYQLLAMRTAMPQNHKDAMDHALFGLGSEAGELMTHWKAHRYYGAEFDLAYMAKELGDALWFLQLAASAMVLTLDDVGRGNIGKLTLRYPDKFSAAAALARADENLGLKANAEQREGRVA
jgi:NTP pyrophosphatase (non-canonical NTP hydrolase)